ncbi:MAG: hypothetical protein RLY20_2540 [Verrucomicrobiota bacterium]|jgi:prepilin-type N-terminal cleavage/methylation domain-containing protein
MLLRARNLTLQEDVRRAVPAASGLLWLVVGGPGRVVKTRSGLDRRAFTLMELLLVLALLAMAVAVAAPSLSRFFRARALDSEARRLLSLTRYAQSRAVSEGVPMVMWFKPDEGTYGVEAESTYTETDEKAVQYEVDSSLQLALPPTSLITTKPWKITTQIAGEQPAIRFTPDGYAADTSPVWVAVKLADNTDIVWLALDENHIKYALQTTQPLANP